MLNKYWAKMTPEERSAEMARRRAKSTKPAGGFHYLSPKKRKEISLMGVEARKHEAQQEPQAD